MAVCRWCNIDLTSTKSPANHVKWCDFNPKRNEYRDKLERARASISEKARLSANEKIRKKHENGHYKNSYAKGYETRKIKGNLGHTEETKKKLQDIALKSKHTRIRKSTRPYTCKNGEIVLLDSSWEEALAKRLDDIGIEWIRPAPLEWIDSLGVKHNYFPDFFLVKYDIYLDPKNPEVFKRSTEKINALSRKYPNIRFLTTLEECRSFEI